MWQDKWMVDGHMKCQIVWNGIYGIVKRGKKDGINDRLMKPKRGVENIG